MHHPYIIIGRRLNYDINEKMETDEGHCYAAVTRIFGVTDN